MPVQLSQSLWLERHKRGGNGLARGEVGRVDLVERATTTGNALAWVLQGTVDERGIPAQRVAARNVLSANGCVEDVRVGWWYVGEHGLVEPEVLGENAFGRMSHPVV